MMNDIEKAIETLKDMKGVFDTRGHKQYSLSALDLAISALEKQIAKKPKKIKLRQGPQWLCPACGSTVGGLGVGIYKEFFLYCNECGQRIDDDWSGEDEIHS